MPKPVVIVNYKTYEQATGEACVRLARELDEVAKMKSIRLILCVPATEIRAVASVVHTAEVYAQHVDAIAPGAHTGWMTPAMLLAAGARGTLLNHSEHRVIGDVAAHIESATKAGLRVVLCAQDSNEVKVLRNYPAEFIAVEPPELIGGEVSVEDAHPELIAQCARQCPDRLLVGAGVKSRGDVAKSLELGAKGVLVASHIVKAQNPKQVLLDMCTGW